MRAPGHADAKPSPPDMEGPAKHTRLLVVWRFADGLRGHENQSDGLIAALAERTPLSVHTVATPRTGRLKTLWRSWRGRDIRGLPNPDLLIGTGNATHLPMLAARRRRGGRAVVLMKPSLPMSWFDLVIAPRHDQLAPRENLLSTRGALNRMRPAPEKNERAGLILIGGPERRHPWDAEMLEAQIKAIVDGHREIQWCAASSRRTPRDFLPRLRALGRSNLDTAAVETVDADWLPGVLAEAATVWVTEDSVNMLYEALSAGAATGLLSMPQRNGRQSKRNLGGGLLAEGLVTSFDDWQRGRRPTPAAQTLNEAGRCAEWILQRWHPRVR
jgi:uncharacterized protein